jgi:antitoxin VapB
MKGLRYGDFSIVSVLQQTQVDLQVNSVVDIHHFSSYTYSGDTNMALNIKNESVERLAAEVARLSGESKTEAVRRALEERKARLVYRIVDEDRVSRLRRFLETEVWPLVPAEELGRKMSREEEEQILGYGREGV